MAAFNCFDVNFQRDFTLICELDSIANQVHNDLAQSVGIPTCHFRHLGGHLAQKLDSFFVAPESKRLQRGFEMVAHIEIHHFQINFSGLDFGEIQNVVDDRQQGISRQLHRIQIFALFRGELSPKRKVRHSHDAVQRRTNFVAHVRQELAFCVVGGLGHLLRGL